MTKKLISIFAAAMMLLSLVPAAAFAERAAVEPKEQTQVALWDLEADPLENGWEFIDEDGDNNNWQWINETYSEAPIASSGEYSIRSRSYFGAALTPDNWAVSPAVELPEAEAITLSVQAASYMGYYPETFALYAFVDGAEEPVALGEDMQSPSSSRVFEEYTADLSEYAGQTVQVAVRHYNCVDQYMFYVDDIAITADTEGGSVDEPAVIDAVEILDFVEPAWGENPFLGVTVPDGANYTVDFTEWRWFSYELGEGDTLPEDEAFDNAEYIYSQYFRIMPNEGYTFSTETTATINGGTDLVSDFFWIEELGYYQVFTVNFTVEEPADPAEENLIAGFYFETDPEDEGWEFFDNDGDGYNWSWMDDVAYYAYEGSGSIASNSYYGGSALTPDNWAISPEITLGGANNSVTFYAFGRGGSYYCEEHFAVYAGSDMDDMTEVLAEQVTGSAYTLYTVDLSGFENQTVRIAIRHFNCTNMYALNVDQFEVWGEEGETPVEPAVLGDVDLDGDVDTADALMALRYVMGLIELDEDQLNKAEVNGDGEVTVVDPLLILRKVLGLIESFPAEEE